MKIRSDQPSQYRLIYANVLLVLFGALIVLATMISIFSSEFLSLVMPSNYIGAGMPLAVLTLGVAFQATQQVTGVGISLEKKTYLFARVSWITVLTNLVLNMIFIPSFGALGAAWATTLSFLVLTSLYLYYTQILHPLPLDKIRLAGLCSVWLGIAAAVSTMHSSSLIFGIIIAKLTILLLTILVCGLLIPWRAIRNVK